MRYLQLSVTRVPYVTTDLVGLMFPVWITIIAVALVRWAVVDVTEALCAIGVTKFSVWRQMTRTF